MATYILVSVGGARPEGFSHTSVCELDVRLRDFSIRLEKREEERTKRRTKNLKLRTRRSDVVGALLMHV
jgi:hypothetical protein